MPATSRECRISPDPAKTRLCAASRARPTGRSSDCADVPATPARVLRHLGNRPESVTFDPKETLS